MDEPSTASANKVATSDYDLAKPLSSTTGLRQNLSSYGDTHFSLFLRKAFIKALGYSEDALSRPIVGIVNTSSGFNPCHANGPQLLEAAKRGVNLAGGLAVDFPTISLHESFASPTSMFLRNLMSMDTEGDDPGAAGGRCSADRGLRQDDARSAHGRDLCKQAGYTSGDGPNDAREP
ncbi:dihydroxy-acid/6-phosphogluconate dehydratase [Apiospora arundinis]